MRHHWGCLAALAGAALLQGCAKPAPAPEVSSARVFASDLEGGAKVCTVPKRLEPADGKSVHADMRLVNDGGWCGLEVAESGPAPFTLGLVARRPAHGDVYVHTVGDVTRIDYTPDKYFGGPDQFTVQLVPGNAMVEVAVAVEGGAAAPTPPPAKPSKSTTKRRHTS